MWTGACVSSIGTWMQVLAQSWLVYQLSNSAVYLGLDSFFAQIPIFLFSLFGGAFADRNSRRSILLFFAGSATQLRLRFGLFGWYASGKGLAYLVSFVHGRMRAVVWRPGVLRAYTFAG